MRHLLIDAPSVPVAMRLDEAVPKLSSGGWECLAVTEDQIPVGLCTKKGLSSIFSERFGRAIYGRSKVGEHMEKEFLCVGIDEPIVEILDRVFSREVAHFWKDVVVLDESGRYLGLFRVTDLAKLQNQLVSEKIGHLEDRGDRLESANESLRLMTEQLKVANAELALVRDESLQAARSKSEFLAVMSHEIRTPLNGILGMLSLLVDTDLDEEQRELSTTAHESAEALLLILNDILDFSRLDSGKFLLEEQAFNIRELAESVLTLMAESAQERDLEVVCDIDLEVPEVLTSDAGRIRQILANMIGNAVKFTQRGEVGLRITREPGKGRFFRFEVSDTGIGISEEAQNKLFSPFAQADSSTTRLYGGTGLGLAISKKLVRAMGGEIGCRSKVSEGSVFWFTVACKGKESPEERYRPKRYAGGHRALLALGNQASARSTGRELEARGIEVQFAYDQTEVEMALRDQDAPCTLLVIEEGFWRDPLPSIIGELPVAIVHNTHGHACGPQNTRFGRLTKPMRIGQLDRVLSSLLEHKDGDARKRGRAETPPETKFKASSELRILLVEDHAVNRRLVEKLLSRIGFSCDVAVDGLDALALCENTSYELILLDCNMPRMDGFEFASKLRELESQDSSRIRSRVVALTANAMQGDEARCRASGMDDYMSKPLKKSALESLLRSIEKRERPSALS